MFQPDKLADLISEDRCAGPRPYTLESLASWLEKKPAGGEYNYHDCAGLCLLSQYATAHGDNGFCYTNVAARFMKGTGPADDLAVCSVATKIAMRDPQTFGAALERTRAAIKAART